MAGAEGLEPSARGFGVSIHIYHYILNCVKQSLKNRLKLHFLAKLILLYKYKKQIKNLKC